MNSNEQHPAEQMPAVDLHFQCTMGGGVDVCEEPAEYILRGHTCATRRTGEGALFASCRTHLGKWEAAEYPLRCRTCKHEYNSFLDAVWDVVRL